MNTALPSIDLGNAAWIAHPLAGGPRTTVPAPYLRTSFTLDAPVTSAKLTITALGLYEAEINGTPIGDQVFAPGWTNYNKRVQVQTYEVGPLLSQGENVLGALLGDGWYCGYVSWLDRQVYGDRPRLLAHLRIELAGGGTVEIATDPAGWVTTTSPLLLNDTLLGEHYDARRELAGWSAPGYDASAWLPAVAMPAPDIALVSSDAPPVRRIEEIPPKEVRLMAKHWAIIDFGQNFSGRVRLRIKGAPTGRTLRLRHAEIMEPHGRDIYTENLRGPYAQDAYTCAGRAEEVWEPHFTFHGFRYLAIEGIQDIESVEATGIVLHNDMEVTGHFACSNPMLNQLQHNILWGQKSNFLEVPTDCPQRNERLGWTGDAQVFVRTAAFNMDVRGFFHKWGQDVRDAQSATGAIPSVCPDPGVIGDREEGGPAWSDAGIICPWTIYLCYGDTRILEENYEAMSRYLNFLYRDRSIDGIREHPDLPGRHGYGDWLALDGSGKTEGGTPVDLIGTAFVAYDAGLMARIATILGHEKDAVHFAGMREEAIAAFRKRYVTPQGLVYPGLQTAYVLALHFDLLPEEQRAFAAAELAKDVERRGFHLATGFVGTPYLLAVLERFGYLETAYKLLEQDTFPSWLFPIKNGATTIWERWDGWTPEKGFQDKGMNSFNHYAYGAVGAWMYSTMAGLELDPADPGYKSVIFRPRPGGSITWAEASLKTAHGLAGIRWDLAEDGKSLSLKLTVPNGVKATLLPPEGFGDAREVSNGELVLNRA